MKPTKVLIIGDDPARYESAFGIDGFQLRTAPSAGRGFAILQMFKADVVVLDLSRAMDLALTWLAAARQLPGFERLPVIVVTSAADGSAEYEAAMAFGARSVLSRKLWAPASLVASVRWAAKHRGVAALDRVAA